MASQAVDTADKWTHSDALDAAAAQSEVAQGNIVLEKDTFTVGAATSPTGEDLSGEYQKVTFKTLEAALAYFGGSETRLLEAASRDASGTRKGNARAELVAANEDPKLKYLRGAAKSACRFSMPFAMKDGEPDFDTALAYLKANTPA